jgi:hypothetical protein
LEFKLKLEHSLVFVLSNNDNNNNNKILKLFRPRRGGGGGDHNYPALYIMHADDSAHFGDQHVFTWECCCCFV